MPVSKTLDKTIPWTYQQGRKIERIEICSSRFSIYYLRDIFHWLEFLLKTCIVFIFLFLWKSLKSCQEFWNFYWNENLNFLPALPDKANQVYFCSVLSCSFCSSIVYGTEILECLPEVHQLTKLALVTWKSILLLFPVGRLYKMFCLSEVFDWFKFSSPFPHFPCSVFWCCNQ